MSVGTEADSIGQDVAGRIVSLVSESRLGEAAASFCPASAFFGIGKSTMYHLALESVSKTGKFDERGMRALFVKLAEIGVDIDARDGNHETPLLKLMRMGFRYPGAGFSSSMRILLDLGAKPDASDDLGVTPSMMCCVNGFSKELVMLLDSGAKTTVRTRTNLRGLPFFVPVPSRNGAVRHGSETEILNILVSYGVDLTQKDANGQTVSHCLAKTGDFEFNSFVHSAFIESCGAEKDKYGVTPQEMALLTRNSAWLSLWEKIALRSKKKGGSSGRRTI